MRLAEHLPGIDWSDADLKWWASTRGMNHHPVCCVDLSGAIHPDEADCAEITWGNGREKSTVRRFKRETQTAWKDLGCSTA